MGSGTAWGQKALSEFMGWNRHRSDLVLCGHLMPSRQRRPELHGAASRGLSRSRVDFLCEQRGLILKTDEYLQNRSEPGFKKIWCDSRSWAYSAGKAWVSVRGYVQHLEEGAGPVRILFGAELLHQEKSFLYMSTNKLRKLLLGCHWCNIGKHWEGEADPGAAVADTKCKSQGKSY